MNKLMISLLSVAFLAVLIASCKNKTNEKDAEAVEREIDSLIQDSKIESGAMVWQIDFEKKTMARNKLIDTADLDIDSMIVGLNSRHPNIKMEKVRHDKDTLVTQIKDANWLTERSGSTGAEMYVTEAIMNLTSAPGVKYLRINFQAGSHASPGIWQSADITELKRIE